MTADPRQTGEANPLSDMREAAARVAYERSAKIADYAAERAERDWHDPAKIEAVKQVAAEIAEAIRGDHLFALPLPNTPVLEALKAARDALTSIADGEAFRMQRFAEDDDVDYFLRCQREVQKLARPAADQMQATIKTMEL